MGIEECECLVQLNLMADLWGRVGNTNYCIMIMTHSLLGRAETIGCGMVGMRGVVSESF